LCARHGLSGLRPYEKAAREARIGIWSGDFDIPWDWRAQLQNR
jgi:endonuclease YncB( thermonuclease family)